MRSSLLRGLRGAMLAASLALAACDAPNVVAVSLPASHNGSPIPEEDFYYRWRAGSTIRLYAHTAGAPEGFDLAAAARTAAARWNAAARFADFELVTVTRPEDADAVLRFRFTAPIVDLLDCEPAGGGAGRTVICFAEGTGRVLPLLDGGGGHVMADVYVDPLGASDAQLAAVGLTRQEYFQALVTHEVGHVIGIGSHSSDPNDLMTSLFLRTSVPTASDEWVLRWVWLQQPDLLL